MELEKLRITRPLGLEEYLETDWVNVSYYNYLRVTACSDTNVTIEVLFSHNAHDIGPRTMLKQTKQWTTRRVDILLDWMKLRVSNDQPIENKFLIINALGRKQPPSINPNIMPMNSNVMPISPNVTPISSPKSDNEERDSGSMIVHENDEPKDELRAKSPFKSILRGFKMKKDDESKIKKSVSWERLPSFIPRNALLVGQFSNTVTIVAPPENGKKCILIWKDDKIQRVNIEDQNDWKI